MDPAALAGRLEAIEERHAGGDAERRAALLCARELRRSGRAPRVQSLWFRPQRHAPRALYAALGVAGSVAAVSHAVVGLALAGGAFAAALLETAGVRVLAPVLARRATQNVVAPAPVAGGRVLLLLCASVDAPRRSLAQRLERLERARATPGLPGLLVLGLAAVAGCAGARVAGAGGTALGVVQLVPSALLILLLAAFVEAALAPVVTAAPAAGPAVALALAATLDAQPPRGLAAEVLITGAGEAGAAGMAAYVAERRHELRAEEVVVLQLGSAAGPVRFVTRDGEHVGARLHPRLAELAASLPGTRAVQGRGRSSARVARGARWPAIVLEGEPRPLAAAALRLIAAIDREVSRGT